MQISYKLPGLMPEPVPPPAEESLPGPSFRNRIRRMPRNIQQSWRGLLRLQHAPAGPGIMGPPPRPAKLAPREFATEKLRWRDMLDRHCRFFDQMATQVARLKVPPTGELQSMHGMLSLLLRYRDMEDDVAARALYETKG